MGKRGYFFLSSISRNSASRGRVCRITITTTNIVVIIITLLRKEQSGWKSLTSLVVEFILGDPIGGGDVGAAVA